jgi:hypothetical protein
MDRLDPHERRRSNLTIERPRDIDVVVARVKTHLATGVVFEYHEFDGGDMVLFARRLDAREGD